MPIDTIAHATSWMCLQEEAAQILGIRWYADANPEQQALIDALVTVVEWTFDPEAFEMLGGVDHLVGMELHNDLWNRARATMAQALARIRKAEAEGKPTP